MPHFHVVNSMKMRININVPSFSCAYSIHTLYIFQRINFMYDSVRLTTAYSGFLHDVNYQQNLWSETAHFSSFIILNNIGKQFVVAVLGCFVFTFSWSLFIFVVVLLLWMCILSNFGDGFS